MPFVDKNNVEQFPFTGDIKPVKVMQGNTVLFEPIISEKSGIGSVSFDKCYDDTADVVLKGNTESSCEWYGKEGIFTQNNYTGKNLFNIDAMVNGTVLTKNENGTYTLCKTSTGDRFATEVPINISVGTYFYFFCREIEFTGTYRMGFVLKRADGTSTTIGPNSLASGTTDVYWWWGACVGSDIISIRPFF